MFAKLLVPLDRSFFAEQALGQAAAIVRCSGAALRLILVHQPLPFAGFRDIPWFAEQADAESEYLQRIAKELALTEVSATHAVIKGDPVEMICREASDVGADLIVMTSHGRTGLSRTWLGSVADGVIRHSAVPVLMLRPEDKDAHNKSDRKTFKKLLVTVDDSPDCEEIIPVAEALAQCEQAQISVLQIVPPVPWITPMTNLPYAYTPVIFDEQATKNVVSSAEDQINRIKQRLQRNHTQSVDAHVVVAGSIASAIIDFAKEHQIDAIAMATHGHGQSRLLLGSVVDKVVRGSDLPMLLFHPRHGV